MYLAICLQLLALCNRLFPREVILTFVLISVSNHVVGSRIGAGEDRLLLDSPCTPPCGLLPRRGGPFSLGRQPDPDAQSPIFDFPLSS